MLKTRDDASNNIYSNWHSLALCISYEMCKQANSWTVLLKVIKPLRACVERACCPVIYVVMMSHVNSPVVSILSKILRKENVVKPRVQLFHYDHLIKLLRHSIWKPPSRNATHRVLRAWKTGEYKVNWSQIEEKSSWMGRVHWSSCVDPAGYFLL